LQLIHIDVAKVDWGCCIFCKCFNILQEFVQNVSSVLYVCCKRFIWILPMFHTYVATVCSKCLICSSLPLQQVFSCCKLQVLYLDVAYVFTYMLQLYVLDVLAVSDICCIQMFSCCMCFMLFRESGAQRSDGGMAHAPGNGHGEPMASRRGA
jgi:hypothetical protein